MNLDAHLDTVELIDCSGRITHRLALLIDGKVRVRIGSAETIVDPVSRAMSPERRNLGGGEYTHDQVIGIACSLARRR